MGLFLEALAFAAQAHGEATRKGGKTPAILHAAEAAAIAATLTDDERVLAAAVLHDTVEDTDVSLEELQARFGGRVSELVASETEDKLRDLPAAETWRRRKEENMQRLFDSRDRDVQVLFLSDKLSNMRAFYRQKLQYGDRLWELFNQHDPEQHHWYYRTIAGALPELEGTPAWREYDWLIKQVFEEE